MSHYFRGDLTVDSPIVKYRVYGQYLGIRTRDGQVFFIYRPSFIGYWVKSYVGTGIVLIFLGSFLLATTYAIEKLGELIGLRILLWFLSLFLLVVGAILIFIKERYMVIESSAGLRILFRKGLTDEEISEIVKQLVEGKT